MEKAKAESRVHDNALKICILALIGARNYASNAWAEQWQYFGEARLSE
jgi:hypothetical protein